MADGSIVQYLPQQAGDDGHRCGYCGKSSGSVTNGMWTFQLTCQDYQDLIDRGWRRSGQYCYKFKMSKTCCPAYTIKCDASLFKATKSQKKVMKTMSKYLTQPEKSADKGGAQQTMLKPAALDEKPSSQRSLAKPVPPPKGAGADPSKPACLKAKVLRQQRKQERRAAQTEQSASAKPTPVATAGSPSDGSKSIEDFMVDSFPGQVPMHRLKLRLVESNPKDPEFKATQSKSFALYKKYQERIHHDPPGKCTVKGWKDFLVTSPLIHERTSAGPEQGYGSFHQQYYLDDELIAVGVIDILPHCVSSVYVYYDPDLPHLSLGTYTALREILITRQLSVRTPALHYYYMGFYIQSCQKMKYKGNYAPSFLVCPETYAWVPIEECRPKLDVTAYSRLDTNGECRGEDIDESMGKVSIFIGRGQVLPYEVFGGLTKHKHDNVVREYVTLAGKAAENMMLILQT